MYDFLLSRLNSFEISPGNVVSTVDDNPLNKDGKSSADFPSFMLELVRLTGPITTSSSSTKWSLTFNVSVATGSMSSDQIFYFLSKLMYDIDRTNENVGIFEYRGHFPLKRLVFNDSNIGLSADPTVRNVKGYSFLSSFVAELYLSRLIIPGDFDVRISE